MPVDPTRPRARLIGAAFAAMACALAAAGARAGDMFNAKLAELSHGAMLIDQFPGAQLGQEPQMLQKIRTGDIDFIIASTANAATVQPESGIMSVHFIFRDEEHLAKCIGDPAIVAAMKE